MALFEAASAFFGSFSLDAVVVLFFAIGADFRGADFESVGLSELLEMSFAKYGRSDKEIQQLCI
jgi:hypothetical protein